MAHVFSVPFAEVNGWPKSEWNRGFFTAERKLHVHWGNFTEPIADDTVGDRIRLLRDLNTEEGRYYPYPDGPGKIVGENFVPLAYAKQAKIEPARGKVEADPVLEASTLQPIAHYEWAHITVTYTNEEEFWIPRAINGLRITERFFPLTINETVPKTGLRWTSVNGPALNQSISRLLFGYTYRLTINNLLAPPTGVAALIGTVNDKAYTSYVLGQTFEIGTLLYKPPDVQRTSEWGHLDRYNVVYDLVWHANGWNNQWNPATPGWEPVYNANGLYIQYPPADFDAFLGLT